MELQRGLYLRRSTLRSRKGQVTRRELELKGCEKLLDLPSRAIRLPHLLALTIALLAGFGTNSALWETPVVAEMGVLVYQSEGEPFTGTWKGPDPDDDSTITLSLTQRGSHLEGTFSDAYSQLPDGRVIQPGWSGPGSGHVISSIDAQMSFDLTRSDGATLGLEFRMTLSNQNNSLILSDVIANGNSIDWSAVLQRQEEPHSYAREDPFNLIHQVEVDEEARGFDYQVDEIPEDAFTEERIEPERKEDEITPEEPERIHPMLARMIEEDPSAITPVIIMLRDEIQVPRFPDLPDGIRRESPEGERLSQMAEELINDLLAQRSESTEEFLAAVRERGIEIPVIEQFWLINAFVSEAELSQVQFLLEVPQLTYIQPRFTGEEPPQDGNANNDVDDGRARIVSDPYFNLNLTSGYIGLLDTGIRTTHVLFNNPSHIDFVRDCVNGGSNCNNTSAAGWNPNDDCWNHGTSSAAIIVGNNRLGNAYRGVTAITLDSWKIYGNGCGGIDNAAAVRAFQRAIAVFDRVIVGEIQAGAGENGAIAQAADNAYDAGAVVVAANGNAGPGSKTVRSPGLAHRVIGIGAYDVVSQAQYNNQGRGSAPDGRYKPDLQAPYRTETASNANDNALTTFGGTSGSTPYAAGAAALMRNWLRQYNTFDNGQVYSRMIISGPRAYSAFNNTSGVGRFRMPTCGHAWWGKVSVNQGTVINIPINIGSNRHDLEAALWWPEAQTEKHDDIDLHIIDSTGKKKATSISGVSVFERARVGGNLKQGTWKIRIKGYKVQSGPQTVYWTVDVHGC